MRGVVIAEWSGGVPANDMDMGRLMSAVRAAAAETANGKAALIGCLREGVPLLNDTDKGAVIGFYRDAAPLLAAVSFCAEGRGLWARTIRGMMLALKMQVGARYPLRVDAQLSKAGAWICGLPGVESRKGEVADLISRLNASRQSTLVAPTGS